MTNEDLKRFYEQHENEDRRYGFTRYDENGNVIGDTDALNFNNKGRWIVDDEIHKFDLVFIERDGILLYYIALSSFTTLVSPDLDTDPTHWKEFIDVPVGNTVRLIQLSYNGQNILKNNVIQTFDDISELLADRTVIVVLYNEVNSSILRPTFSDIGSAIEFTGTVLVSNESYNERIIINSENAIKNDVMQLQEVIGKVTIIAPESATEGTLTNAQLTQLTTYQLDRLIFNHEVFYLADDQTSRGYLVYSHCGEDSTHNFYMKCITITLSTRGWVLTSKTIL